jgi:hypothetical protein
LHVLDLLWVADRDAGGVALDDLIARFTRRGSGAIMRYGLVRKKVIEA